MWKQSLIDPIFTVALNRPPTTAAFAKRQAPDGYLTLGSILPPVKTVGTWAVTPIEYTVYVDSISLCSLAQATTDQ
jgi:hypothetical protein